MYIFILYLVTTVLASVVLVVLLTLSHKSPVVRPSITQRADGLYRLKCGLTVIHLVLSPFSGVRDPVGSALCTSHLYPARIFMVLITI